MTVPDAQPQAAPQTEVTIPEQGSAGGVGEVGRQTPDKSPDQIAAERALARRASVEKAFEKAKIAAETKAATEAKEGKTPGEDRGKPSQEKPQQPRDRGRFASAQPAETDDTGKAGQPGGQPSRQYAPLAETAPYRDPPPRFSDAAKADWAAVPESVRGATDQAFRQYEQGIQQYRSAAEAFQEVADYHELARSDGKSLRTIIGNYHGMEQKLRGDLFGGLDLIVHNLGLTNPQTGQRATFADVATAYLQQSPEQRQMAQHGNYAQAQHAQIAQLSQYVQSLATNFQQMQYQQRFSQSRSMIDQFADSHPGFDERSDLIKQELDHGYPLHIAYERAMKLRPGNGSTRAAQTRNTSAQTRDEIDRSISGAPANGAAAAHRTPKKSGSNREALINAQRRARSGV